MAFESEAAVAGWLRQVDLELNPGDGLPVLLALANKAAPPPAPALPPAAPPREPRPRAQSPASRRPSPPPPGRQRESTARRHKAEPRQRRSPLGSSNRSHHSHPSHPDAKRRRGEYSRR